VSEAPTTDPRFTDALRAPSGAPDAAQALRAALGGSLGETVDHLHDEAVRKARLGLFAEAEAKLHTLLSLDPEDGEALVLLARVLEAGDRPQAALAALETAQKAGHVAPEGLRERLEEAARQGRRGGEDDARARVAAREHGELRSLRAETRTLRSELLQAQGETLTLKRTTNHWRVATAVASLFGMLMVVMLVREGDRPVNTLPRTAEETKTDVTLDKENGARTAEVLRQAPPAASPTEPNAPAAAPPATPEKAEKLAEKAPEKPADPKSKASEAAAKEEAAPAPTTGKKGPLACTTEKTVKSGPCLHTVRKGDTFGKLAQRYYGKSSLSSRIAKVNQKKPNKMSDLKVGSKLLIP
jgi:nucleoid-associated protein YgaU